MHRAMPGRRPASSTALTSWQMHRATAARRLGAEALFSGGNIQNFSSLTWRAQPWLPMHVRLHASSIANIQISWYVAVITC